MKHTTYILLLVVFFSLGCKEEENIDKKESLPESGSSEMLFDLLDSETTGIDFINRLEQEADFHILTYRNFYNDGGVAIGDTNNDGLSDIYFSANQKQNKLYLNKGKLVFEDISESAGVTGTKPWSTGVSMADVNGDGLIDIYVSNSGDDKGKL